MWVHFPRLELGIDFSFARRFHICQILAFRLIVETKTLVHARYHSSFRGIAYHSGFTHLKRSYFFSFLCTIWFVASSEDFINFSRIWQLFPVLESLILLSTTCWSTVNIKKSGSKQRDWPLLLQASIYSWTFRIPELCFRLLWECAFNCIKIILLNIVHAVNLVTI